MNKESWFYDTLQKFGNDLEFKTEQAILDFTEKVSERMIEQSITRTDLAQRLEVSKAFVSKLLNGNPNLTIKSMVSIADALKCNLSIDICYKGFKSRTFYHSTGKSENRRAKREDFKATAYSKLGAMELQEKEGALYASVA
jgi:transcriptional regulator with XRE-family HTH domain